MQTQAKQTLLKNPNVIRESSVYSDIKKSVHNKDNSAFSLLLAMVTQDRMELDEFHLPQNKVPQTKSDLEKTFNVVPKKLIDKVSEEENLLFNQLINSGCRESVTLLLNLHPQPLIVQNHNVENGVSIPAKLFNSLDINQQAKLYKDTQNQSSKTQEADNFTATQDNHNIEMDIESWFSVLEQSRTLSKVA